MKEKEITAENLEAFKAKFAISNGKLVYKDDHTKKVGWLDDGYLRVKVNNQIFYQHRIAWFLYTGAWPILDVDHIDNNKSNNFFDNLRLATSQQNMMNRPQHKNKKLPRGVYWSKERQKFRSILCVNGVNQHLGYFVVLEDALEAYKTRARQLFGEFVYEEKSS